MSTTDSAEPGSRPAPGRVRRRAVVNLHDARPVWTLPGWAKQGIASSFAADWDVRFVDAAVDGRGDGGSISDEAIEAIAGAEVYFGFGIPEPLFVAATSTPDARLRWVHTATAGVASLLYPALVESDVILTNSAGVHAPAMAETVLAMMLHFARGIDIAVRGQAEARWESRPFEERVGAVSEIQGATLGIIGFGGIGQQVSQRALALGMQVVAIRRSNLPGPAGVEVLTGADALERLLRRSDVVVAAVPSTKLTRALIGAGELAMMKPSAVLVNISRGDVVDERALIGALTRNELRGAALDVFADEPLPAASPLWKLPNVLITPHVSATSPRFWLREVDLIRDNIARYLAGRGLRNVVDAARGY
ncbi:MAG: D-2-hydroxyacid dehydrogenase [Gemmatimonadetes bacterium]|nr:D-2-hydroxyacid dehydrogenase [Gemmatimonadota bacterium]